MAVLVGFVLVILGLAVGFIVAWSWQAGSTAPLSLFKGVLLILSGGIVGFLVEWIIDEAYRKNRELRRLLGQQNGGASPQPSGAAGQTGATKPLAEFLRRRDEEVEELRQELEAREAEVDRLHGEFNAYQQTHPDDMTVIKGIGSVYQWKLRDAGINTYSQLAQADADQLRRMLDIQEWQRVDVESWIEQARDWATREA